MRYVLVILGVLLVIGALVAVKGAQIGSLIAFGEKAMADGPPPEAVGAAPAEEQTWENTLDAIGNVASSKGVSVSNEVPGTVTKIHFESGALVKQGDVLVELDTSVEQAQLKSALARKALAGKTLERTLALSQAGAVSKAQADADESQLSGLSADASALAAQISKKTIRAPFAGRLGIRNVDVGQYLNPGTPVAELESIDDAFVDFTLPQKQVDQVSVGMPVRVAWGTEPRHELTGQIKAVEPSLDSATRSVRIRAGFPNDQEKLRPGMFVDVAVVLPAKSPAVVVPATAVVHAPYGDSVFVIEDKKPDDPGLRETAEGKPVKVARQQFVRAGRSKGDFVEILEGVKSGEQLVTAGAFKLRNGAPVFVGEGAEAKPQLDPKPENR